MNVIDTIQVILTVVVSWFVIVFLLYFLLIKITGYRNAGLLARALYSIYLISLFLYSIFLSPYARHVRVLSVGFYIAIAVLILLLLFVILTGTAFGAKKRGGADA